MPGGTIEKLANLGQTFNKIGDSQVALDKDRKATAGASSWLGRTVNWIKSALDLGDARRVNSGIMEHVVKTIRNTQGLGDSFADIAKGRFGAALDKGTPITGRKVSQVISDVIGLKRTKDNEALLHKENIKYNLAKLCDAPSQGEGSPSRLEAALRKSLAQYGMPDDMTQFTENDLKTVKDKLEAPFLNRDRSPESDAEFQNALDTAASRVVSGKCQDIIHQKLENLQARFQDAAKARGMDATLCPQLLKNLRNKAFETIRFVCMGDDDNMHPPTDAEVKSVTDKLFASLLDALQVVDDDTSLNQGQKDALKAEMLASPDICNPVMAKAMCKSLGAAQAMIGSVTNATATTAQTKTALEAFETAFDANVKQEKGGRLYQEGIDEKGTATGMKEMLIRAGAKLAGLTGNTADQPLDRMLARGSAMNEFRFQSLRNPEDSMFLVETRLNATLLLLTLGQGRDLGARASMLDMKGVGMDSVTFAQARAHLGDGVHTDVGLPEIKGFDMTKAKEHLTTVFTGYTRTSPLQQVDPSGGDFSRSVKSLQEKVTHFSSAFLVDFFRNGITVDGETIEGTGNSDDVARERALDRLIAHFPSVEEAGRATRGVFQVYGVTTQEALFLDPATNAATDQTLTSMGNTRIDHIALSMESRGGGAYGVTMDYSLQHDFQNYEGGEADPRGMCARIDVTLTGMDQTTTPPTVRVDDFDFIFATMRH
ncbi:hypothetical protein [Desulfocurvus sp. DL9XJH121]